MGNKNFKHKNLKKKQVVMATMLLLGIISAVYIHFEEKKDTKLVDGSSIYRNEWGKGDYRLSFSAVFDNDEEKTPLEAEIKERIYSDEETDALLIKADAEIKKIILNGNADPEEVKTDLSLPLKLEGYPFDLRWNSSDEEVINRQGVIICEPDRTETYRVVLKCDLSYEGKHFLKEYPVRVIPPDLSSREKLIISLKRKINEIISNGRENKKIVLPNEIDGVSVSYEQTGNNNSFIALVIGCIGSLLSGYAVEYDEKNKQKKKEEKLSYVYPLFVRKLKLYLVSGLTMKNAFRALTEELSADKSNRYTTLVPYLNTVCIEFENNVREEDVYEKWGSSCKGRYKKLSFLMGVNLKQGSDRLLKILDEEVSKAALLRREAAKKKGDEAGVKLLFPMMLMLLMVMMLIMLPAYFNFI